MKGRPASSFAHLLFVQAAVSAKNHSQASSERRGGRVKDSGEDELTLRTCQQGNANRRMREFPSWTTHICFVAVPNSPLICTYEENKDTGLQEHSLSLCCLPLFFVILFSTQNVHPRVETRPALSALYFEQRAVSFCACHHERISPRLTSLDEYDSSAEELEILRALFKINFFSFFYLVGERGHASHETRMYNDKGKNKLLLCIIM